MVEAPRAASAEGPRVPAGQPRPADSAAWPMPCLGQILAWSFLGASSVHAAVRPRLSPVRTAQAHCWTMLMPGRSRARMACANPMLRQVPAVRAPWCAPDEPCPAPKSGV